MLCFLSFGGQRRAGDGAELSEQRGREITHQFNIAALHRPCNNGGIFFFCAIAKKLLFDEREAQKKEHSKGFFCALAPAGVVAPVAAFFYLISNGGSAIFSLIPGKPFIFQLLDQTVTRKTHNFKITLCFQCGLFVPIRPAVFNTITGLFF